MICSICQKEIPVKEGGWAEGNNAQPVNDGRCCDECNYNVVIPARMREMLGRAGEEEESPEHWLYLRNNGGFERVVGEGDHWTTAHQLTGETGRLFAAAPALLSALKTCVAMLEDYYDAVSLDGDEQQHLDDARAAIAKVEGGSDT